MRWPGHSSDPKTRPALGVDEESGREMFFNAAVAAYTGWSDVRNDASKSVLFGDGRFAVEDGGEEIRQGDLRQGDTLDLLSGPLRT